MKEILFNVVTKDGADISCCYICPDEFIGTNVLLCHGFGSSKNSSTNLFIESALLKKGMGILKFDFRGSGDSKGDLRQSTITTGLLDLDACIKGFEDNIGEYDAKNFIFMGASFGGAVAFYASKKHSPKALVLKSPALDIYTSYKITKGKDALDDWQKQGYVERGSIKLDFTYLSDSLNYKYAEAGVVPFSMPISIIHGGSDDVIPVSITEDFINSTKNHVSFFKLEGANHLYSEVNYFPLMINFITTEICKYI